MSWTAENSFVLSLILEDGLVGATFPYYAHYDRTDQSMSSIESADTPDGDVFRHIAGNIIKHNKKYSERNISCYFRADRGLENGYSLANRYREYSHGRKCQMFYFSL